jgi:hypothetical protein
LPAKKPPTKATPRRRQKEALANHEVVVLAAYLAGAQKSIADTEDIAIKANDLAPGRFTWRKYKDQINIDTVRKRLWDATKPEKGAYLIGTEKAGWRLTKAGFDFARKGVKKINSTTLRKPRKSREEQVSHARELRRMMLEDAFVKFANGRAQDITKGDAERFFRIDDYVTGQSRSAKVERFKIIASSNERLSQAIELLATLVREK